MAHVFIVDLDAPTGRMVNRLCGAGLSLFLHELSLACLAVELGGMRSRARTAEVRHAWSLFLASSIPCSVMDASTRRRRLFGVCASGLLGFGLPIFLVIRPAMYAEIGTLLIAGFVLGGIIAFPDWSLGLPGLPHPLDTQFGSS